MSATIKLTEKKKALAPKLRFKEFEKEWDTQKLLSFINFISGYAFNSAEMKSAKSKYQLIKMSNVYKSELDLDRSPSYWDEIDNKLEKFLLRRNDIILTLTGTVGKQDYGYSVIIPEDNKFLLNQRLVCLRYIPNKSEGNFINNLIKTSRFYYLFFGESKGGTGNQTNVGSEDLKNIRLNIPTLPEQQKIASFLSAIDEKIQQLTRKKELLEQYKKGVMQQVFSGKLRFKSNEGKAFPKWDEKRLGEVADIIGGGTPDTLIPEYWDGDIQWYTPTEISERFVSKSKRMISKLGLEKSSAKLLPIGTILFTSRATIAELSFSKEECTTNQGFQSMIVNSDNNSEFIFYWIKNNKKAFIRKSQGSTFLEISKTEIVKIKILSPCLEEQQKIGNYLSSIDNKIESVNKQISDTQIFKKGLLQQMFV